MNEMYEKAMVVKNILIFFTGFVSGAIVIAVLGSIAIVTHKSRRSDNNLTDISFVKIQDGHKNVHLVFNIRSFTQAFYYIFASVWTVISPRDYNILVHDKVKERVFFCMFAIVGVTLIYLAFVGIVNIAYVDDSWDQIDNWIKIQHPPNKTSFSP